MSSASFRHGFGFGDQDGARPGQRRKRQRTLRKARLRSRVLESLEPRTLLAVLPPPSVATNPITNDPFRINVSNPTNTVTALRTNESNPSIAVSLNNPNKMVMVWQEGVQQPDETTNINQRMAFSLNGGQTWTNFNLPQPVFDPSQPGSNARLPRVTDLTVSFDRNDNIYIAAAHQAALNDSGAIVLQKYQFAGNTPNQTIQNKILYAWSTGSDAAINPVLAVDNTLPVFTDPNTFQSLNNPFVGYVYVAWGTDDFVGSPNTIKLVASSDGGQTFTTRRTVNDEQTANGTFFQPTAPGVFPAAVSGNTGPQRNSQPRIVISQGTLDGAVAPGQVTIMWDDFGTLAAQGLDLIRADRVSGTVAGQSFTTAGTIASPSGINNDIERITNFPITVNINAANFINVRDVNLRLAIENQSGAALEVTLVAPDGRELPLIPLGGFGQFLGIGAGNQVFGTVFDQESTLPFGGGTDPFIGHFLPDFQNQPGFFNLSDFYNRPTSAAAGTWFVRVRNTSVLGDINLPPILRTGTLEFSSGLNPGVDTQVTTTAVLGTITTDGPVTGAKVPFPLFDALAPVQFDRGVGPGATIASDNSVSALLDNSGRLYVAYVDYVRSGTTIFAAQADNTDIFLRFSDDGGLTWSSPRMVNDDTDSNFDGFSESLIDLNQQVTFGRPQFMPSLAVDSTTGTLAVSFYDARWDAGRTRPAMTVTTSLDGGNTFSPQDYSFVNAPNAPFDEIVRNQAGTNIGPIPDNLSAGNPDAITFTREGPLGYGFGDRQALLFLNGSIFVGWSSNENGGNQGLNLLDIRLAKLDTAAGPRIISSTMGSVQATTVNGVSFNATVGPDGAPQAEGFQVQFDRPVDVRTFTTADVTAFYRSPTFVSTPGNPFGEAIGIASVTPLDRSGPFVSVGGTPTQIRATSFLVRFNGTPAQLSRVGSYSYAVGPDIVDFGGNSITALVPNPTPINDTTVDAPLYTTLELPIAIPANTTITPTLTVSGFRADELLANLDATIGLSHAQTSALRITLIGPDGTRVPLALNRGSGADYVLTTFTDASPDFIGDFDNPFTGEFQPESPLAALAGRPINGVYRLEIVNNSNVTGSVEFFTLKLRHGPIVGTSPISTPEAGRAVASLDVAGFQTTETIKSITVNSVINHPRPSDLTVFLIHPDGTRVALPSLTTNVITVPLAGKAINGTYRLEANDLVAGVAGTIDRFWLDINSQQQTAFPTVNIPQTGVVNSRVTLAGFSPGQEITNITVTLSIQHGRSRDLQIRLIAPDGTSVLLAQNRGGNAPNVYNNTTFSDAAATSISVAALPFANGTFKPEVPPTATAGNDLANLIGKNPNGQWTLQIQDTVAGTGGNLTSASMRFETKAAVGSNALLGVPNVPPVPAVPANPAAAGRAISTLPVSPASAVQAVDVTVSISHPAVQQLSVYLVAPGGQRVTLVDPLTGGAPNAVTGNSLTNTRFIDGGALLSTGAAPYTGNFAPVTALSTLLGVVANGIWQLEVVDRDGNSAAGSIVSWSLNLTTNTPYPSADVPQAIPDNTVTGIESSLGLFGFLPGTTIPNVAGAVEVTLNITHPAVQELDVSLVAPNGDAVQLITFGAVAPNAVTGANFTNMIFSSGTTGATFLNLSAGAAPYNSAVTAGTVTKYRPAGGATALDIFNGDDPSGIWTLRVSDRNGATVANVGTLTGWSLNLLTTSQYGQAPAAPVPGTGNGAATTTVVDFPVDTVLDQLDVTVSVAHTGAGELSLFLVGPDNSRVLLGSGARFTNTTFTDNVQQSLSDGSAPFTGLFRPEESLNDTFSGKLNAGVNGVWRLEVSNSTGVPATITQFQIALRAAVVQSILPGPIPDGPDGFTTSTINVVAPQTFPGVPEVVSEVSVVVGITHTRISDLQITLIAPDGTRVLLSNGLDSNNVALQGADYDDTIFMDNSTLPINFPPPGGLATLAPYSGRFRPVAPLYALVGKNPNGLWRLEVKDTVSGEEGTLDRFRLRIRTVPAFQSTDVNKAIPNPGVITSTTNVSGFSATDRIADVNVNVKLTHPQLNNLQVTLIAPDGTRVQLTTNAPPVIPPNGANFDGGFDDQAVDLVTGAARPIEGAAAPLTGRFVPVQPLSGFNSRVPNGTWTLEVRDTTGANPGAATLDSWSIEIQTVDRANEMPKPVNDLSFTTAELVVSGVPANQFVNTVTTHVSITHPRAADLEIYLIGPNGLSVTLAAQRGGNAVNAYIDTTFSDAAAQSITTAAPPFTGTFRPEQPLAGFFGVNPNGVWQLLVFDRATGVLLPTEGLLNSFSITINTATVTTTITAPNAMDQNSDGLKAEAPAPGNFSVDAYATPRSFAGNPFASSLDKAYNGTPFQGPFDPLTLPLMISGPHVADTIAYPAKPAQVNKPIPDNGTLNSTLTIAGDVGRQVTSATVKVDISHLRVGDLVLSLIAPDGTEILLAQNLGGAGDNYTGTIFDDAAVNFDGSQRLITSGVAPFAGRFRPQSFVSALEPALGRLVGRAAAGTWTLRVRDTVGGTVGTLNGWSLELGTTLVATDRAVDSFHIVFDRDMDPSTFTAADIVRIDGPVGALAPIDPQGGLPVTVTADPNFDPNYPDPDPAFPRTYRVTLTAPQSFGGSYTVVLGPNIRSKSGLLMDANRNAGLDALRGEVSDPQAGSIQTVRIEAKNANGGTQLGLTIPANGSLTATLPISDNFLLQDVNIQLNIAHTNVPNLEARLVGLDPGGDPDNNITVLLFRGVGNTGNRTNFSDTIFDDAAGTPIQIGGPPFSGPYNPQVGLPIAGLPGTSGVPLSAFNDQTAARTWQLEIINTGGIVGTLNSWSLTFQKPVPGTGLGEAVADQTTVGFRLFTMDPTTPLAANTWSQVGPAGIGARGPNLNAEVAGRVNAIALDPSDPSGNIAYIATPAGGIWKTTNFLTKDPTGPTWLSLTPDAPTQGLHIGAITVVGRNNDPAQSIILAGTGDAHATGDPLRPANLTSRGIGFLRSMDGGKTWELLDSQNNNVPFSTRDHFFAAGNGTRVFKIVSDPKLTPTGEAIFYAAVSDLSATGTDTYNQLVTASGQPIRGGLWRSVDNGNTWTQMRTGQATDVVLDLNSGAGAPGGNIQRLYAAFRNDGIYESPNRGQLWNPMAGVIGKPLFQNGDGTGQPVPVPTIGPPPNQGFQTGTQFGNSGGASTRTTPNSYTTNAAGIASVPVAAEPSLGKIILAKPEPTGEPLKDALYQGWLYAAVMVHNEGDLVQTPPPLQPPSALWGLFVTKDYGATWTKISVPAQFAVDPAIYGFPTNWHSPVSPVVSTTPQVDPTGVGSPRGSYYFKGNFSSALAVDPTNPNVIYFGSSDMFKSAGMIRVDTTGIADPHAFYLSNDDPDEDPTIGAFRTYSGFTGPSNPTDATALNQLDSVGNPLTLTYNTLTRAPIYSQRDPNQVVTGVYDPKTESFLNLLRDPAQPFLVNATVLVGSVHHFNNPGTKSKWIPWTFATQPDPFASASTDTWSRPTRGIHQILTLRDPLTQKARIIMVNDNGVYTALDEGDGTLVGSIGGVADTSTTGGNLAQVNGSRNGNLAIAEFLAGASQPSTVSAELSVLRGMFYGTGTDTGQPISDANIIDVGQLGYGNLSWQGTRLRDPNPALGGQANLTRESGYGVGVSQTLIPSTGQILDYVYFFANPEGLVERDFTGDRFHPATDFFQANGISVTNGLVQTGGGGDVPDGQWPFRRGFPFAVNPRDGGQVLISSNVGRIFLRDVPAFGDQWVEIGNPTAAGLDGTLAQALAFGAPKPTAPGDPPPTYSDHLYAGTIAGNVYVTFTGGGTPGVGNQWTNITSNLPLVNGARSPIVGIFPNPDAGSHELYLATETGVFYMADSSVAGATWTNITGTGGSGLFGITFDPFGNASLRQTRLQRITSLQVDWRYVIPDNFGNPNGPTHPLLYVAGDGGVYRSIDKGGSWHLFPDGIGGLALNESPLGDGGGLPNSRVTDLDLSIGPINQTTGRPDTSLGPNILLASTYGTGQYAIRLAPLTIPNQTGQPRLLGIDTASDTGLSNTDHVTNDRTPNVIGLGEQTAFGNVAYVTLYDLTDDPANPRYIGGFPVNGNPTDPANLANTSFQTNTAGRFGVTVLDGMLATDGVKTIGVQATSLAGTKGNMATFQFTLDTTPPAAPSSLDLLALSDTGLNNNDQITRNNANLQFRAVFTADPNGLDTQVILHRNNLPVGAASFGLTSATVVDPGVVNPDGTYAYRVRLTDQAGNTTELSASPLLNVRVDTRAPAAPSRPQLDPNNPVGGSDSGVVGDNITNVKRPFFSGTAEANNLPNPNNPSITQANRAQLLDAAGNVVGSTDVTPDGKYLVQPDSQLSDGSYTFVIRVLDVAGNASPNSQPINVTIVSTTPTLPTLKMVLADDSGIAGDNITNVRQPRLEGTGDPNLFVQIIQVGGTTIPWAVNGVVAPLAGAPPIIIASDRTYQTQFPLPLGDGTYQVLARTFDVAGNFRDSAVLTLTIVTQGPTQAPTLVLLPDDDSGKKLDNVTSIRKPRFRATAPAFATVQLVRGDGVVLDTKQASSLGEVILQPPLELANGAINLVARLLDTAGNVGPNSPAINLRIVTTQGDYNADGIADLATYRPVTGAFQSLLSNSASTAPWPSGGTFLNVPIQGDFDGDGRVDLGYFQTATSTWVLNRSQLGLQVRQFGTGTSSGGQPVPVPADYDGDGLDDLAVFDRGTATWVISQSRDGNITRIFGQAGDTPVPADYDGDFKADIAVFRAGTWSGQYSGGGTFSQSLGQAGDFPVPADYTGDGRADLATYRQSNGLYTYAPIGGAAATWTNFTPNTTNIPAPADFDKDGKADFVVFLPSTGTWVIPQSSQGNANTTKTLGAAGDKALLAPFDLRTPTQPTIAILTADDSGTLGDGITNVRQPRMVGAGIPGLSVRLIDVTGAVTGVAGSIITPTPVTVAANGVYVIQFPNSLAEGTYSVATRMSDAAGNSIQTAAFALQIVTGGPGPGPGPGPGTLPAPSIVLDAASDTGIKGDGRTSLRRPSFTIVSTATVPVTVQLLDAASNVLASTFLAAAGSVSLQPNVDLANGLASFRARIVDQSNNNASGQFLNLRFVTTIGDLNADGAADFATYRRANGDFSSLLSGGGTAPEPSGGTNRDVPIQGDFDGDGRTDLGYFRPSTATWVIQQSSAGLVTRQFGPGGSIPIVGDFDGDGRDDIGVYVRSNSTFFLSQSTAGNVGRQFGPGGNANIPVVADFDGDAKADIAVFVPNGAVWYLSQTTAGNVPVQFGNGGIHVPAVADFDGDNRADIAVYQANSGQYLIRQSTNGVGVIIGLGGPTSNQPVPQDFDNDGKADAAVFKPSVAQWLVRQSSNGQNRTVNLGAISDVAVGTPYQPWRVPPTSGLSIKGKSKGKGGVGVNSLARVVVPSGDLATNFLNGKNKKRKK